MLLTLTSTHRPATDLGYLLRKNPARAQTFELTFGLAHVFYSEASEERCSVTLLVEVDPVGLVRKCRGPKGEGGVLERYVNDRTYAASSFLSVAIAEVFGSALSGTESKDRPGLAGTPQPFQVEFSVLPCRGGEEFLRKLFEPLGYRVKAGRLPLDEQFPEWGESSYFRVELEGILTLHRLLSHLYVLVPVLDNDKHYWVGDDEVEKLLRHGEGWLASHPEREGITRRYLRHQRSLVDDALAQLIDESEPDPDAAAEVYNPEEAALEASVCNGGGEKGLVSSEIRPAQGEIEMSLLTSAATEERNITLNEQRLGSVLAALKASGGTRVLDLGCGEGRLLQALLKEKQFSEIVGMDVSHRALEIAHERLHYDRLPAVQKARLKLLHGSLIYRDQRLAGFDAAAVVEVIEHLDAPRLAAFERVLFECAKPKCIVITTPNREYNVKWETLPAGKFRHRDHRFEWTRTEFQEWAHGIAARFGYDTRFLPLGQRIRRWVPRRR